MNDKIMQTNTDDQRMGQHVTKPACAFTLVEMLVVLAIIMLLLSMLLPALNQVLIRAVTAQCASNLRQQGVAFMLYATDHAGELPVRSPNPALSHNHEGYIQQSGNSRSLSYTFTKLTEYTGPTFAEGGDLRVWRCPAVDYSDAAPNWTPRAYTQHTGGGYFTAMPFNRVTNNMSFYDVGRGINLGWKEYYGAQIHGSTRNTFSALQRLAIISGDIQFFNPPNQVSARHGQFRHGNEHRPIFSSAANNLLSDGSVHWGTFRRNEPWNRFHLYSPEFLIQ